MIKHKLWIDRFIHFLGSHSISYQEHIQLAPYTTFHLGGECRLIIFPNSLNQLIEIMKYGDEQKIPFFMMGNGSNILMSDAGYKGVVIKIGSSFAQLYQQDDHTIFATAGVTLAKLCYFAQQNGLSGLECFYGIPASVGGSIYMNAGAYGGEIKDVLEYAQYVDSQGNLQEVHKDQLQMSYRHSFFTGTTNCITGGAFKLSKSEPEKIKQRMQEWYQKRKDKQPLEYPSAGSTFKRPTGAFAAKLIEDCGLKGYSYGGAQVSQKHSGFVINTGNATAQDVKTLIHIIQQKVKEQSGFFLECEIQMIE